MTFNRMDFIKVLEKASETLAKDKLVFAYQCFRIKGEELVSTDGKILSYQKIDDTGLDCCVYGKGFLDLLKSLRTSFVTIVQDAVCLHITAGKTEASFPLIEDGESIEIPSYDNLEFVSVQDDSLFKAIGKCMVAVSKDVSDDAMCGVHISDDKVYATDQNRIIRNTIPNTYLLSGKTLSHSSAELIYKNFDNIIGICVLEETIVLALGEDYYIRLSLLSGTYPVGEITGFFSAVEDGMVELCFADAKEAITIIKQHMKFQSELGVKEKSTSFQVHGTSCKINTLSSLSGVLEEDIELTNTIEEGFNFTINPAKLLDVYEDTNTISYHPDNKVLSATSVDYEYIMRPKNV